MADPVTTMVILTGVSAAATGAGAAVQAVGTIAAGKAEQKAAEFEAAGYDVKAKEELAAAQQEALEFRRRKNLALSSLQARAAGSGFSATDASTLNIAAEIEEHGTQQQRMALYGGRARAKNLRTAGAVRRMEGRNARRGAGYAAAGTILGGISSMGSRYVSMRSSAPTGRSRYD